MATVKAALKSAKLALEQKKYGDAEKSAAEVLKLDSENYHGYVFLARALDMQSKDEGAANAYRAAIKVKENDVLAWQGLVALFNKDSKRDFEQLHGAVLGLACIYRDNDARLKCTDLLDKYMKDARVNGTRTEYKRSLEMILPTQPLYAFLEGLVPQPGLTYKKIADITELEEKEKINAEIGQRRTRLGARIEKVTDDVKKEVLKDSQLEFLYSQIISWAIDDELRYDYEERLLRRAYDVLIALPRSEKGMKRKEVYEMASGMVLIKRPVLLAWQIELEWKDVEDLGDMDQSQIEDFINLFPLEGLAKVLRAFIASEISPFPKAAQVEPEASSETESGDLEGIDSQDSLLLMTDGFSDAHESVLAHRIMSAFYLALDEHECTITTARSGLKAIAQLCENIDLKLEYSRDAVNRSLATALIYHQSPRHHADSKSIFEDILRRRPSDIAGLVGIGMIYEEEEEFEQGLAALRKAMSHDSDVKVKALAAWYTALAGDYKSALPELEECLLAMDGTSPKSKTLRAQTLYRAGICIWHLDTSKSARQNRDGAYARYLASIQTDINFAPAYTALGVYYVDYGRDRKRARRCFQKAFELSPLEINAAFRLAESFADAEDWDLVEAICQRVITCGKIQPAPGSKKKAISWPYASLGTVQMQSQDFAASILSFQSALRISPLDYNSWIGLGESYQSSGRYVAAAKALEHALQFDVDESEKWFAKFMLANVRREVGEFDLAVDGYQAVLKERPTEFGVMMALLQTLVDRAWSCIGLGLFGRAAASACEALDIAHVIFATQDDSFNLWKAAGDAAAVFSSIESYESSFPLQIFSQLLSGADASVYEALHDIDGVSALMGNSDTTEEQFRSNRLCASLHACLLAFKRGIAVSEKNHHAKAVAWYNLGWAEYRAHIYLQEHCSNNSIKDRKQDQRYLNASVQAFKRCIELEAGNSEFWNSLGIVTSGLSARVSQHAFVRSLFLNEKNARVWTNLGACYLSHGDKQLAAEAFTQAQSTDPDYALAWFGHGLLAEGDGDAAAALHLFTHAYEISDSSYTVIKQQYSRASFDHISTTASLSDELLQPLLAINQLNRQICHDIPTKHLSAMFAERAGNYANASTCLEGLCETLELAYEEVEEESTLSRFAQAKSDLARAQLAQSLFPLAIENAEMALELSSGLDANDKVRLSAHLTAGLAHFFNGSNDDAISMFRSALTESNDNPDVICLLAQVLWAKGGESERAVAREQLLLCAETNENHVKIICLLACIALSDRDDEVLAAIAVDLEAIRCRADLDQADRRQIADLLCAIQDQAGEEKVSGDRAAARAAAEIMLEPSNPHGWIALADASKATDDSASEAAVLTAHGTAPPRGNLTTADLCKAYATSTRPAYAQRAIMYAPYIPSGWECLARNRVLQEQTVS